MTERIDRFSRFGEYTCSLHCESREGGSRQFFKVAVPRTTDAHLIRTILDTDIVGGMVSYEEGLFGEYVLKDVMVQYSPNREISECPVCSKTLSLVGDELYCDDISCGGVLAARLSFFSSTEYLKLDYGKEYQQALRRILEEEDPDFRPVGLPPQALYPLCRDLTSDNRFEFLADYIDPQTRLIATSADAKSFTHRLRGAMQHELDGILHDSQTSSRRLSWMIEAMTIPALPSRTLDDLVFISEEMASPLLNIAKEVCAHPDEAIRLPGVSESFVRSISRYGKSSYREVERLGRIFGDDLTEGEYRRSQQQQLRPW